MIHYTLIKLIGNYNIIIYDTLMRKILAVQFLFFIPLQLSDVTKVFSFLAIT